MKQIQLLKKYTKLKILQDTFKFRGHENDRKYIYDLFMKAILHGESHSALVLGPRGVGKSTLINSVLLQISNEVDMNNDVILVKLQGLLHHDEKVALKTITAQMQLENAVGDKVFGTFAESFSFLLSCLMSGKNRKCRTIIFILDDIDMFCHSGKTQTLLYNLFDITHNKETPMCVVGLSNCLDVVGLLEKRVLSRFSHRHIYIFPNESEISLEYFKDVFVECLSLPDVKKSQKKKPKKASNDFDYKTDKKYSITEQTFRKCKIDSRQFQNFDAEFIKNWNEHVKVLVEEEKVVDYLEKFSYFTANEQIFRNVLFEIMCKLSHEEPYLEPHDIITVIDNTIAPERRVKLLQSLSILELSLVIAMMHATEVFSGQPMNFEMVLHRYTKFANENSSSQTVPRAVILKAFEHLHALEVIMPVSSDSGKDSTSHYVQKEYRLYNLAARVEDIKEAVKGFKSLPTEIQHWANNSID